MPPQNAPPRMPATMQRHDVQGAAEALQVRPDEQGEDEPDPVLALPADVEEAAPKRERDGERGENQRRRGAERLLEVARRLARLLSRQPLVGPVEARSLEDRPVRRDRVVAGEEDDEAPDQEGQDRGRERDEEAPGALLETRSEGEALLGLGRRRRWRDAHAAVSRRPPVIAMPSSSSVTSGPYSPTIRPPNMTRMRSESDRISSSSRETRRTARPSSRSCDEAVVDELDGSDVQPPRRLAGHEHPRVALHLAGDDDLLLVATRQGRGERRRRPAAHVELLQEPAGERDQAARAQPAKTGVGLVPVFVEPDVLGEREVQDEPTPLAVFRDMADPIVEALARRVARDVLAGDPNDAALSLRQPGERVDQLRLTVPVDACDADDLTCAHLEGDALNSRQAPLVEDVEVLHLQ